MAKRKRRNHAPAFKAQARCAEDKALAELARQFDVHPHQTAGWRRQFVERAGQAFGEQTASQAPPVDLDKLRAKIRRLILENDFLEGALA